MERGERLCQEKGRLLCEEPHSRHDDSTAEALYSNEDEDTLEDVGAAAELESVEYRDLVLYARRTAPTKQVKGMQSGIPEDTTQPQRRIKT